MTRSPDAEVVLLHSPSRARALAQAVLLLLFVFVAPLGAERGATGLLVSSVFVGAIGLAVMSPWAEWRAGRRGKASALTAALLIAVALSGWASLHVHPPPVTEALPSGPVAKGGVAAIQWLCVRAFSALLLVGALIWRDGQGPAQVGLRAKEGAQTLRSTALVFLGTYGVHLALAAPLAGIGLLTGLAGKETAKRTELIDALSGTHLSVPVFGAAMVLVAGFEEVAFRAFLVPRLQRVTGRWWAAVALSAAVFGLGHFYEGSIAVLQTMALGAYFGWVFTRTFRLIPLVLAHAAFNTINYALMLLVQRSGLLK